MSSTETEEGGMKNKHDLKLLHYTVSKKNVYSTYIKIKCNLLELLRCIGYQVVYF